MAFAIGFSIFLVLTAVWAVMLVRFVIRESRRRARNGGAGPGGRARAEGSGPGDGTPSETEGGSG